MKKLIAASITLALVGVSGCATRYADVPAPTRFENAQQQKLQAASHWQIIANHAAAKIAADLGERNQGRAVFVPQPEGEQPFVGGFRELLITSLVQQGIPVHTKPAGALTVDVDYSVYKFAANRAKSTYYYGEATMLAAGLWAVGGVLAANVSSAAGVDAGAKLLATAAGLDGFSWLSNEAMGKGKYASGEVPQSEIILTTSISDGTRIVSRNSSIYYTSDADTSIYWNKGSGGTALNIQYRGDK